MIPEGVHPAAVGRLVIPEDLPPFDPEDSAEFAAKLSAEMAKPLNDILGLDLSLTSTGYAHDNGHGRIRTTAKGMARLSFIRRGVLDLVTEHRVRLVVIEGYSFNSKQGGEHLGELGGVVRLALWERNIEFVEIPPASLKTAAVGRGNASKDEVLAAAIRRLGYAGSSKDEADALWLRTMALVRYNLPGAPVLPAVHLRNWPDAVAWPELREEAA